MVGSRSNLHLNCGDAKSRLCAGAAILTRPKVRFRGHFAPSRLGGEEWVSRYKREERRKRRREGREEEKEEKKRRKRRKKKKRRKRRKREEKTITRRVEEKKSDEKSDEKSETCGKRRATNCQSDSWRFALSLIDANIVFEE